MNSSEPTGEDCRRWRSWVRAKLNALRDRALAAEAACQRTVPHVPDPNELRKRSQAVEQMRGNRPSVLHLSSDAAAREPSDRVWAETLDREGIPYIGLHTRSDGQVELGRHGPYEAASYRAANEYYSLLAALDRLGVRRVFVDQRPGLPFLVDNLLADLGKPHEVATGGRLPGQGRLDNWPVKHQPESPPLVTVFTAAYNHAAYVGETIESVLRQDYPNLEHLVLDDGSTDATADVIDRYGSRIRAIRQQNIGEIRTMNRGMQLARGEFVVILNDDDTLFPGAVSAAVAFMQRHPDVLACYPDFCFIDQASQLLQEDIAAREFDYHRTVRQWACLPGPGIMVRRRALELEPERDTRYEHIGDMEYWLRLGLHGPLARLPELQSAHRTHPRSKQVYDADLLAEQLLDCAGKYFSNPNLPASVQALRRQAHCSAYFEAAMRYPANSARRYRHLARSIAMAPWFSLMRFRKTRTWKRWLAAGWRFALWCDRQINGSSGESPANSTSLPAGHRVDQISHPAKRGPTKQRQPTRAAREAR